MVPLVPMAPGAGADDAKRLPRDVRGTCGAGAYGASQSLWHLVPGAWRCRAPCTIHTSPHKNVIIISSSPRALRRHCTDLIARVAPPAWLKTPTRRRSAHPAAARAAALRRCRWPPPRRLPPAQLHSTATEQETTGSGNPPSSARSLQAASSSVDRTSNRLSAVSVFSFPKVTG